MAEEASQAVAQMYKRPKRGNETVACKLIVKMESLSDDDCAANDDLCVFSQCTGISRCRTSIVRCSVEAGGPVSEDGSACSLPSLMAPAYGARNIPMNTPLELLHYLPMALVKCIGTFIDDRCNCCGEGTAVLVKELIGSWGWLCMDCFFVFQSTRAPLSVSEKMWILGVKLSRRKV